MRITRNFNSEEFECNCGCEMPDWVMLNNYYLAVFIGAEMTFAVDYFIFDGVF